MKVLSLFDGISCGRVALHRAGITVSQYVAFEIDQDAINVSAWNWPDIEHKGSVEGADFTQYQGIDLLIGGSPCQDLSLAGKRRGLAGVRSRLFWEYVRAKKEANPRRFLFENVASMKASDREIITEELGVAPIMINSGLVSAQNRKRLYWTNIPFVEEPEDRLILLPDVLEGPKISPVNGDYIIVKDATVKGGIKVFPGQSYNNNFPNSTTNRGRIMRDKSKTVTCKPAFKQYIGGGLVGIIQQLNTNDYKPYPKDIRKW